MKKSGGKSLLIYLAISAIIIFGLVYALTHLTSKNDDVTYSTVMEYFDDLKVSEYEFDLGTGELEYKLKGEGKDDKPHKYNVPMFHFSLRKFWELMVQTTVSAITLKTLTQSLSITLLKSRTTACGSVCFRHLS